MREAEVQKKVRAVLCHPAAPTRLWRNNVGAQMIKGKWVEWGLCKGSGDLIGIVTRKITPEMVGTSIGQFFSAEIKTEEKGSRLSDEQKIWIETVRRLHGVAEVFRSEHQAIEFLKGYL